MPRKPREFFNTSFFHVMSQGINKEYIFEEKSYKNKYLKLLFENTNNNKCRVTLQNKSQQLKIKMIKLKI